MDPPNLPPLSLDNLQLALVEVESSSLAMLFAQFTCITELNIHILQVELDDYGLQTPTRHTSQDYERNSRQIYYGISIPCFQKYTRSIADVSPFIRYRRQPYRRPHPDD